nr:hypothetical protein [Desulfobulbaceae bacterium]
MSISDTLWNKLGELPDNEALHVLTNLFATYETLGKNDPDNKEIYNFFRNLDNAIEQTTQCNLNRR